MILLTIHLYVKLHEPLSIFDNVIKAIKKEQDELLVTSEYHILLVAQYAAAI